MTKDTSTTLGIWGEECVAQYLRERGFTIVCKRWHTRFGEVDIIAQDQRFLCFVEVKLRKDDKLAPARAFVTPSKQRKLRTTAEIYLSQRPTKLQPRMDVAEIYAPQGRNTKEPSIVYWENAF